MRSVTLVILQIVYTQEDSDEAHAAIPPGILANKLFRQMFVKRKSGNNRINCDLVGLGGLEPPTSPLSVLRSLGPGRRIYAFRLFVKRRKEMAALNRNLVPAALV